MECHKDFAERANPHSWLLVADNLHEQAVRLRRGGPAGYLTLQEPTGRVLARWPAENRAVFLLAGFALENALKAFLVYQNPEWVSNGRLARRLKTHSLTNLSMLVVDLPWPKRGPPVLREFERGLESWARYPCALAAEDSEAEPVLRDALWRQYLGLMSAYGKALMTLLARGWSGPHGTGGVWEMEGGYLGAT